MINIVLNYMDLIYYLILNLNLGYQKLMQGIYRFKKIKSPSMTSNTPIDFELKCGLLDDVFTIIDLEKILTGNEEQIGGFDLIFKGGPVKS